MKLSFINKIFLGLLFIPLFMLAADVETNKEVDDISRVPGNQKISKPAGFADEAIGVMDKGQLQNLTMNYGQLSDVRYEDVGNAPSQYFYDFRYPRKNYTGLGDDFSIFFAVPKNTKNNNNGNVIDGWTDNDNEDWIAKDGSYGATHYNSAMDPSPHAEIKWPPDSPTTPYLAHSDLPATWPVDQDGTAFWPGYFRRDPATGEEVEGEFASDRDVYAVFDDSHNQMGNPLGLEVEMMAYCYGRPYADKFQFYEFYIHNKSGQRIDSCYVGYYHDPDCSDYGEEILVLSDPTFSDPDIPDIIMQRDIDGDIGGATRANSKGITEDYTFGCAILETPKDIGVTSFHYYQDAGPTDDKILWPIISSDPTDPDIASFSGNYFHGTNKNFDDCELLYTVDPQDLVFIVASGPFSMEADEVVKSTIVVAIGENDADFYKQMDQAVQMFDFYFLGPSAPPAPTLSATKGDGFVTLYWDDKSENTPDAFTSDVDFEGYRVYRSEDNGQTWGEELKDSQGNLIGYLPVAQFDLDNGISGVDERNPFIYLGDDTGIRHTFVDNDVKNGISYSYTVVSYDRGDSIIYSLESARGTSIADRNFVTVMPQPDYDGKVPAAVDSLYHTEGTGKGSISINIIDDALLPEDTYELVFNGTPAVSFDINNVTQDVVSASNLPLNFTDNPVIDGFQISVESEGRIGGIQSALDGFGIDVLGAGREDSSKSWLVNISEFATSDLERRSRDYEIRFVESGDIAYSWGAPNTSTASYQTNIEVWDVTGPEDEKICFEFQDNNSSGQWEEGETIFIIRSPYPDPQIGDALQADFPADFPYQIIISNSPSDSLNTAPQAGDIVKIESFRSLKEDDVFSFSFDMAEFDPKLVDLSEIRVVPNPYIVGAEWEELQNVHQIRFMFLPPVCTINIYTLNGELVKTINHNNFTGDEPWNVTNSSNQAVAFGVYVYVVTTPDGKKYTGKFAIIR